MSDRMWPRGDEHPPAAALLLFEEAELNSREMASVKQHLADCWECRVRFEELRKGIHAFISHRRELIPQIEPHAVSLTDIRRRVQREATPAESRVMEWRPWLVSAIAASIALIVFYLNVSRPQTVSAAEFLRQVTIANDMDTAAPRRVIRQRVQLRHGIKILEHDVVRRAGKTTASNKPDAEWQRLLKVVPLDWQDPLSVADFERWHSRQPLSASTLSFATDAITLSTVPSSAEPLLRASLTVRRSDSHPVAKQFDIAGEAPIEVKEVAYEIIVEPAPSSPPPIAAVAPATTATSVAVVNEMDLDRSEIWIREILHRLGADSNELPQISHAGDAVEVRLFVETADRRREIEDALAGVPHLKLQLADLSNAASDAAVGVRQLSLAHPTTPPLAKALWDYLGGIDPANNYLDMVRATHHRVMTAVLSLERLSKRYPEAAMSTLSEDVRARVNVLAGEYVSEIRKSTPEYLLRMSDPLDAMMRINGLEASTGLTAGGCGSWQSIAPGLASNLKRMQTSFRRLFVVDYVESPAELLADELLKEVDAARGRVSAEVARLCPVASQSSR